MIEHWRLSIGKSRGYLCGIARGRRFPIDLERKLVRIRTGGPKLWGEHYCEAYHITPTNDRRSAAQMRNRSVRQWLGLLGLLVSLVACTVVSSDVSRAVIMGERAGLEELKTEPLLEPPPPGSTELLRTEHVGRGCGLLVTGACIFGSPAHINVVYASPQSLDQVREWYVTTHGARYGLSRRDGSNLWDQTNPHRADEKRRASVMELRSTALRNPLSAYTEYPDLQPTPEGTQTFIILIYGFNEL